MQGCVFKADRLLYHSTLGSRVIRKNKGRECDVDREGVAPKRVLQEAREFGVAVGDVPAPNRLFNCLDLYHTSLDPGEHQYKSRT